MTGRSSFHGGGTGADFDEFRKFSSQKIQFAQSCESSQGMNFSL